MRIVPSGWGVELACSVSRESDINLPYEMAAEGLEQSAKADFDRKDAVSDDSSTMLRLVTDRFDLRTAQGSDTG